MSTDRALLRRLAADARRRGHARLLVPVTRRRSADLLTPVSAFLAVRDTATMPFLLESVEGGEHLARYSFLGLSPQRRYRAFGLRTECADGDGPFSPVEGTIFDVLRAEVAAWHEVTVPGVPRLAGGLVGYLGYDTVRLLEPLHKAPPDVLGLPDALWGHYTSLVAFDHVRHQLVFMAMAQLEEPTRDEAAFAAAEAELDHLEVLLRYPVFPELPPVKLGDAFRSSVTREDFEASVKAGKHHVREGDIFQIVLSQRFSAAFEGDPFMLYRALRQVNPSPYLFYFDFGDFQIVGSSPEVLVRAEGGRAEVLPIAGTRRRGETPEADLQHETDLRADEKERAEHLMLVDLGRNDLGRVCAPGSVTVEDYARVERYSHVMHLVSTVSGRLDEGRAAVDVLAACFPAGTVSGAPKVRAMQLIDELEPVRRGIYAGAVGYLTHRGDFDTCIAIRTLVVAGGEVHVQAGAGIVADSDPALEYEETVNKAQALREAIRVASEELL
ncbi:MAG TPA: anthranilate synthase component I [Rhodothermales bacterium]|nr:anthranilate synthase component I [Rhodothermales bacterium]